MPSAPNPIQTALLILTPIRSNRCAQLLRRHSPQGGTPTLRHGASTIYTSSAPAPDSPTPHVSRMQRTEETAIHSQHGSIHRKGAHRRSGTMHASARTSTHQSTVSTARAPRSMYPASSAQTKPPYTASAAPSTARRHTDAPAWRMLQHAPAHANSQQPRLQHRLHNTCPTPNAARKAGYPSASQTPPPQQRYPATHTTQAPCCPNTSQTPAPTGPRTTRSSAAAPQAPPKTPPPRPSHTDTKKGQTFRSDLEEAATYSPTGKPQYHRRE